MTQVHQQFAARMQTLKRYGVPSSLRVTAWLLGSGIVISVLLMVFTPWIQTAYGEGEISTRNPNQRIQAISALVPGQVDKWHVREGEHVTAGAPLVTLVDTDPELLDRLNAQIVAAEQQRTALSAVLETEQKNLERQRRLLKEGLTSQREVERNQIRLDELRADLAKIDTELNKLRVTRARQSLQTKLAPQNGTVMGLLPAGNATHVKAGDILAQFIPDGVERSVVLSISGLDASLVIPGREVRLQFDGWPVFQFSGWPDMAIGTFAGVVDFVEPVAGPTGRFNAWVKPAVNSPDWPEAGSVRLGSRVRGWILLEEVPLGYELWRQLNNFPPVNKVLERQ